MNIESLIDSVLNRSEAAFSEFKKIPGKERAVFLRAIAGEIESLGDSLIKTAMRESNLPEGRMVSERQRTTNQIRMFAGMLDEGSWVDARIDTAQPDRKPVPKPDLRKMLKPIGPAAVFGASNFPIAFSAAGGDTVSALAAGCSVIVKGHPAHPDSSKLAADAVARAAKKCGMPEGVYQHIEDRGNESAAIGGALVMHPLLRAAGFTGSLAGGRALFDLACSREEPIPFFAEMGSINPVIYLPGILAAEGGKKASELAASITVGAGQFCTNPGLVIAMEGKELESFIALLDEKIQASVPEAMLNMGIAENYYRNLEYALSQKGVKIESQSMAGKPLREGDKTEAEAFAKPVVASAEAETFIRNPSLAHEIFGPYSLIIKCKGSEELLEVIRHLKGQLTITVNGTEEELGAGRDIIDIAGEKAGRLIINGVPTGVEVCPSMQHGGPYPACTDSRFSALGTDSVKRFSRPVAFQNFPDSLLPDELKNSNPLGIWRLVDGRWEK